MSNHADRLLWRRQLAAIQAKRRATRKVRLRRSKVDQYRAELEDMKEYGASLTDLAQWLSLHKRMKVDPSTIGKRFKKWNKQDAQKR